jgi:hypothetical protein
VNLLVKLAEGLNLTSLERREFYIAADGIDDEQVVRPPSAGLTTDTASSELVLDKMVEPIGQLNTGLFGGCILDTTINSVCRVFSYSPEMIEKGGDSRRFQ